MFLPSIKNDQVDSDEIMEMLLDGYWGIIVKLVIACSANSVIDNTRDC